MALVSPFQGHVACRNLALTGHHYYNYLGALWIGGERVLFMLSNLRHVTQPSGFVACPEERAVRLVLGVKQLKMWIALKQFCI